MSRPIKFIIHPGDKFGRLEVLEVLSPGAVFKHARAVKCRCSCGVIKTVRAANIAKEKNTRSCGCWQREITKNIGLANGGKIGKRYRSRLPDAGFRSLWRQYLDSATCRALVFVLTEEEFRVLTSGNCFYCGQPPSKLRTGETGSGPYFFNGIDRKKNAEGYTKENSVSCCWECNKLKGARDATDFLDQIRAIVYHCLEGKCVQQQL